VLGAGISGLATARELARRGAQVTVLDTAPRGTGASDRSLAWLNAFGETLPDYHRFRVESIALHAALPPAEGGDCVHLDGALWWPSAERAGEWAAARDRLSSWGYPFEELSPEQVGARFAGIDPAALDAGFAVHAPGEGWVDLPGMMSAFAGQVRAAGGRVAAAGAPVRLREAGGRVIGVQVGVDAGADVLDADAVVVASGSATPGLLARDLSFEVPVDVQTGLLARTAPLPGSPGVVVNSPSVSFRPEPDGGLAFDTDWLQQSVRPGGDGTWAVDESAVAQVTDQLRRVLRDGGEVHVTSCAAGAKPVPADGLPVLGAVPGTSGCYLAFLHSGATNALHVGQVLADEVLGTGTAPAFLSAARLAS
jgi:glycine/D-amino acid oxidase-like deaminating enzyme